MTNLNTKNQELASLLTRLALGAILLAHGCLKVFVFTVPGTIAFFGSIGFPPVVAYLTMFGEIAGGVALILGIYPRLAALLSLPILIGAAITHLGNGWVFSSKGGGWEFPVLLVVLAIIVALQKSSICRVKKLPIVDKFIPSVFK